MKPEQQTAVAEAQAIVYGDREETYGHPAKNLNAIAEMWTTYLNSKEWGQGLTARDVCQMMVLLKIARDAHKQKRDNVVDELGYLMLIDRCEEVSV